jgi:hypothetical protein
MIPLLRSTLTTALAAQLLWTASPVLADLDLGLVARYQLDGDSLDSWGDHNGVAYGATQTADRFGFSQGAFLFTTNRYIEIPDSPDLHLQQLSFSVWVKPNPLSDYRMVLNKDSFQFFMQGAAGVCLGWFGLSDGSTWHNLTFGATFVPGQWAHMAVTYDSQFIRTYVDGNPGSVLAYSGTNWYGASAMDISRNTHNLAQFFTGAMDDLRIYNRPLSLAEVRQLALDRPRSPFPLSWQRYGFGPIGTNIVSWQSWSGWSYTAMVCTNLAANAWTGSPGFTKVPGTGQMLSCTNPVAPGSGSFIRVKAEGPALAVPPWTDASPLPLPKADLSVAVFNGKLYAIGGYNMHPADSRSDTLEFDPATSGWTRKADMPSPRWGPIAVEFNGKIYVFAGQAPSGGGSARNEVYDPLTDTWQTKSDVPSDMAAQGLMGVRYGDRIHLFYRSAHYAYAPATDTYSAKAGMLTPRTWATCAAVNDSIYIIGGYWGLIGPTNVNEVYNPASDAWSAKAPLPVNEYGATRENPVIGGLIYVTHGQNSLFCTNNYVYNPVADTWRRKAYAQHPRDGVGCCVLNGKLLVLGGRADRTGPYGLIDHEIYDPTADP